MNTRFKVFASYNILQNMCDFIHVLIFVTVSKCRKSSKLTNKVIIFLSDSRVMAQGWKGGRARARLSQKLEQLWPCMLWRLSLCSYQRSLFLRAFCNMSQIFSALRYFCSTFRVCHHVLNELVFLT